MNELDLYIRDRCFRSDLARTKLIDFCGAFRASLTVAQQKRWPRRVLLTSLRQRFAIGKDSRGVLQIGGLSMVPVPEFVVVAGRLRKQVVAPKPIEPPAPNHLRD